MRPLGSANRGVALALAFLCACLASLPPGDAGVPAAAAQAAGPEVWFAPYPSGYGPPALRPDFGAPDYMDLFSDGAPWVNARNRLDVFQFYPGWLLQAPDEHIATAVAFLNSHGIRIAVEAPALTFQWTSNGDPQTCGQGGEGWDNDSLGWTLTILGRVHAAGGIVEFLTMQEPYASASATTAAPFPVSCAWNVGQIANHVRKYVEGVRAVYPGIRIGDVESDHATAAEIASWADAFAAAVGEPLAYMHWDVDWNYRSDWPLRAREVEALMAARGIPFGMIYNGIEDDASSAAWNSHALEHAARYEGEQGGRPPHVKFQSWHRYPQQMLPETDPAAMTSLVNRYFEARTPVVLDIAPPSADSRVAMVTASANGLPVGNASVDVQYRVMDGPGVEATYRITGVVPAGAAQAVVGYRVNMECNCGFKESYFTLYEGNYRQAATQAGVPSAPGRVVNPAFGSGLAPWHWLPHAASQFQAATPTEPNRVRVEAPNAEWAMINSGWFNVTPGQFFEASFRAKVDPRAIGSGYFTIVFATGAFAEVHRFRLAIEPATLVASGVTDTTGTAAITLPDLPPARIQAQAVVAAGSGRLAGFSPLALAGALAPEVTATIPATLAAGAPAQQVRVLGSGFNWDSTATWDGVSRSVSFLSGGELRVNLSAADLAAAGSHELAVSTAGPGGGSDTFTFVLAERTLALTGPAVVNEGALYTLNLSATYPGSSTINRWTVDWGDGNVQVVNGNPSSLTHTYADGPSAHTITATARDADGTWPASNSVAVTVNDVAPAITVTGSAGVPEGTSYQVTFSAADPGSDTIAEWTVDWGDGSPVATLPATATGASHVYATGPAAHSIQVAARDEDGTHLAPARLVSVTNVAPTVTISGSSSAVAGVTYTLDLSVVDPGVETPVAWVIDWGDGSESHLAGTATSATHTFTAAPAFPQVRATFEDGDGVWASTALQLTVFNQPPPIAMTGPAVVDEGTTYTLSLLGNEPFIASWTIDWGDGSEEVVAIANGLPASVNHVYADGPAGLTIRASATDGLSTWQATPLVLAVRDVPPQITVSAPPSVDEGSQFTIAFSALDPGDDAVLQWRVDWGDGSESVLMATASSASHAYASGPATRHAVVTLVNGDGSFAADAAIIDVLDVPPAVSASGPATAEEGAPYTITLSAVDPGTDATTWRIDWGDGTVDHSPDGTVSATHVYEDDGLYTVTVTALQGEAEFPAGSWTVAVADVPPEITFTVPGPIREFNPLTITFSASDPGADTISHWTVDWGDGSAIEALDPDAAEATHAYAQGGLTRTVTLTVFNEDGSWSQQRQVQVLPGPLLTASGPAGVDQGVPYRLTLSAIPAVLTGWTIDWGDGTVQTIAGTANEAEHVYAAAPASRIIRVSGTDSYGTWHADDVTVEVLRVRSLVFQAAPAGGEAGQPFPTQPVVAIVDGAGAVDTTDNETEVVLALAGPGVFACPGGPTRRVVAGIAAFEGCRLDTIAEGVALTASAGTAFVPITTPVFDVTGVQELSTVWYFAEGFTGDNWETFIYLLNPNPMPVEVTVEYFLEVGGPVVKVFLLGSETQRTLRANDQAEGPGPDRAFGVKVTAALPIRAEQGLFDRNGKLSHGSVGARSLSPIWYFAEGFTGPGWLTFVSATNPGDLPATVEVTYFLADGTTAENQAVIAPKARVTFAGHEDVPGQAFSVRVVADVPIVSQEVLIDVSGMLAHGTIGVTRERTRWYLAEGFTGDVWLTFISIGNFRDEAATVTVTYEVFGEPPQQRQLVVGPRSRATFAGHENLTGVGPGRAFGVTVVSDRPIVAQQVLIDPKPGVALAHGVMASHRLGIQFAFAGGTSRQDEITFISVANPLDAAVSVEVTYYFDDGSAPVVRVLGLPGHSRVTFASYDAATGVPDGHEFGARVRATGAVIAQKVAINVADFQAIPSGAEGPGPP